MDMNNDRIAFERYAKSNGLRVTESKKATGMYWSRETQAAWIIWRASRETLRRQMFPRSDADWLAVAEDAKTNGYATDDEVAKLLEGLKG